MLIHDTLWPPMVCYESVAILIVQRPASALTPLTITRALVRSTDRVPTSTRRWNCVETIVRQAAVSQSVRCRGRLLRQTERAASHNEPALRSKCRRAAVLTCLIKSGAREHNTACLPYMFRGSVASRALLSCWIGTDAERGRVSPSERSCSCWSSRRPSGPWAQTPPRIAISSSSRRPSRSGRRLPRTCLNYMSDPTRRWVFLYYRL